MAYYKNKRDGNEKEILQVLEHVGVWQACDHLQGHDGNFYFRGQAFEIEIKRPGEYLTPREEQFAIELSKAGRRLWVLTSDVEAQWLVNGEYERIPDRTDYLFELPTSETAKTHY